MLEESLNIIIEVSSEKQSKLKIRRDIMFNSKRTYTRPLCGFLRPFHYSQLEKFPMTRKEPASPRDMTFSHQLTRKQKKPNVTMRETLGVLIAHYYHRIEESAGWTRPLGREPSQAHLVMLDWKTNPWSIVMLCLLCFIFKMGSLLKRRSTA